MSDDLKKPLKEIKDSDEDHSPVSYSVMPQGNFGKFTAPEPEPVKTSTPPAVPLAPLPTELDGSESSLDSDQPPAPPVLNAGASLPEDIDDAHEHHSMWKSKITYIVLGILILGGLAAGAYFLIGPDFKFNDDADETATRLPQNFLQQHFGSPTCSVEEQTRCADKADPDDDGLENYDEFLERTIPVNNDTDDDGLADGDEVNIYLTDPINKYTDPRQVVKDNDYPDSLQIKNGYDPLTPGIKMTEVRLSQIAENISKFKLHEPTITSLANSTAPTAEPKTVNIMIGNNKFDTASLEINVNDTIVWLNQDTRNHQIASDPHPGHTALPDLVSAPLATNQTFSYKFTQTGTFTYHDHLNPTIKGTVIVK